MKNKTIVLAVAFALLHLFPLKAQEVEFVTPERYTSPAKGTYYQVGIGASTDGNCLLANLDIGRFYLRGRIKTALEISTRGLAFQGDNLSDGLSTGLKFSNIVYDGWKIKPYLGLKGGYVHLLQLNNNTFEYGLLGGIEFPLEGAQRFVLNFSYIRFEANDEGKKILFTPFIISLNLFGAFTKER